MTEVTLGKKSGSGRCGTQKTQALACVWSTVIVWCLGS
jgi:hypothetical protein